MSNVSMGFLKWGLVLGMWMISLYVFTGPVHAQSGLYDANNNTSPVGIPGIKAGDLPTCITVNQEKNLIYVCDSGSDTISVIDGSTSTVINTIFAGGNFPNAIALDSLTNRLYVGFADSNTINEINTVTNSVSTTMPVNGTTLNMISDQEGQLFVTRPLSGNITSILAIQHVVNTTAYEVHPPYPLFQFKGHEFHKRLIGILHKPLIRTQDLSAIATDGYHRLFVCCWDRAVYVFDTYYHPLPINARPARIPINEIVGDYKQGIAFDPDNDLLYVATKEGSVSVINTTSPFHAIGEIPIPLPATHPFFITRSHPDGIAVNPETHTIYVMDSVLGFVYAIDSKCITTDTNKCESNLKAIRVSESHLFHLIGDTDFYGQTFHHGIAVNPNTNMVYVTNPNNNTVSVIDGKTNSLSVGVNFKIDPPNSGHVNCNGININSSIFMMFDFGSLTCEAKANSFFPPPFSYWSMFPPIWFDSWSGDLASPDSDKGHIITFKPTHFGTLVANFNVLSDAYITTIIAIVIPVAGGLLYRPLKNWFGRMRRNKNLNKYKILIDDTSKIANRDKKDHIQLFEEIRKRIVDLYLNGNISDSQYVQLNDEISAAMEKIKSS